MKNKENKLSKGQFPPPFREYILFLLFLLLVPIGYFYGETEKEKLFCILSYILILLVSSIYVLGFIFCYHNKRLFLLRTSALKYFLNITITSVGGLIINKTSVYGIYLFLVATIILIEYFTFKIVFLLDKEILKIIQEYEREAYEELSCSKLDDKWLYILFQIGGYFIFYLILGYILNKLTLDDTTYYKMLFSILGLFVFFIGITEIVQNLLHRKEINKFTFSLVLYALIGQITFLGIISAIILFGIK